MNNTINTSFEILFDIKGYEGLYSITKTAKVYSWKKNIFLKPVKQKNGYLTVGLYKNKQCIIYLLHRLMAECFIENTFNKPMVNHKDLDKTNNQLSNLEWVTAAENIRHFCSFQLTSGEKNGNSKLTKEQVLEIRSKYKFRKYTYEKLSQEYGVMKHYIGRIINNKVWRHI
jgi:hypothetical protein